MNDLVTRLGSLESTVGRLTQLVDLLDAQDAAAEDGRGMRGSITSGKADPRLQGAFSGDHSPSPFDDAA